MYNRLILFFQFSILVLMGQQVIAQNQPAQSSGNLLTKARNSMVENEFERAESELRQFLGIALERLGASYSALDDATLAFKAFNEAAQASIVNDRPLLSLTEFCIKDNRYEAGKEAVQKLLAINPIHPGGRHLLGKLLILMGDVEQASHVLKDAYLAAPENSDIGLTLAYSYLRRKNLEEGVPVLEKLFTESSQSPALALKIGRAFLENSYFSEAESYLQLAVNAGLKNADVYLGQAVTKTVQVNEDSPSVLVEPAAQVKTSTSEIPNLRRSIAFAYGKLSELEYRNQRFAWAEDHISQALWWDENLPGLHVLQGWVRFNSGKLLTAVDPVRKALERQPKDPEAKQLLTRITIELIDNKHLDEARTCTEYLLSLEPNTAFFYALRGRLNAESGDTPSALADFSKALQLNPGIPEVHYNSGILLLNTQGPAAALNEFELELKINPQHDLALFRKADTLNTLGRKPEAKLALQQALKFNSSSIPSYRLLAQIQISEGNLTSATANLEIASKLDPENAEIFLQLSDAYTRAGRSSEAATAKATYERLLNQ